jgi:hypothetical protein
MLHGVILSCESEVFLREGVDRWHEHLPSEMETIADLGRRTPFGGGLFYIQIKT